ncbi:hypothetical protein AVEN_107574-1 [Araneus ventricosus]|uniref:Uncharacterized protein n=1 Tax=Araneus ventricosus TaxID=182803 RepID=A0A4Y2X4D0_ARAVE|nr:hypothetical protein AVEN_107574-1 [Araneus ventricosus]
MLNMARRLRPRGKEERQTKATAAAKQRKEKRKGERGFIVEFYTNKTLQKACSFQNPSESAMKAAPDVGSSRPSTLSSDQHLPITI